MKLYANINKYKNSTDVRVVHCWRMLLENVDLCAKWILKEKDLVENTSYPYDQHFDSCFNKSSHSYRVHLLRRNNEKISNFEYCCLLQ